MVISADLGLEKHISNVSTTCFCHLRQLRHVRRSRTTESATTLVTSQINYCNVIFVGGQKPVTNKLQRLLNAAARVLSGTRQFDRGLTQLLHADLHWLDVHQCVKYKLCMMMRRCQDCTAPQYLAVHWAPVSETASRHHLRSAASHQLTVPPHQQITSVCLFLCTLEILLAFYLALVLSGWYWCGWQGYRKRLRELFIRAGYQTSAEQWRLQAEAAVATEETKKHDSGEFETLYECRAVSFSSCWTRLC